MIVWRWTTDLFCTIITGYPPFCSESPQGECCYNHQLHLPVNALGHKTCFQMTSNVCVSGVKLWSFPAQMWSSHDGCNSPSYINKSSSTSLRKSSMHFRLSICQWRDFHKFAAHFDCDDSEWLSRELYIRVGKLQSLTPETQTFDAVWKHVLCECIHGRCNQR